MSTGPDVARVARLLAQVASEHTVVTCYDTRRDVSWRHWDECSACVWLTNVARQHPVHVAEVQARLLEDQGLLAAASPTSHHHPQLPGLRTAGNPGNVVGTPHHQPEEHPMARIKVTDDIDTDDIDTNHVGPDRVVVDRANLEVVLNDARVSPSMAKVLREALA